MRIKVYQGFTWSFYTLTASADDTERWATRPGSAWPCSTLRGKRIRVTVNDDGLCEFSVTPTGIVEIDGRELEAFVSDATAGTDAAALWPRWEAR